MTNTNCLAGIQCPDCGNEESFRIAATTIATVTDDGTEDHGDMEWDDDSYAECTACHRHGTLKDFTVDPEPIQKQLTSSGMVHTPGLFRALRNDYRIKGEPRRRAIKILSDVYGLPPDEAKGLLSGAIRIEIDEAAGTITYHVADAKATTA